MIRMLIVANVSDARGPLWVEFKDMLVEAAPPA